MNIISLDGVSKATHGAPLFSGVSLGIEERDRLGLVGRNGSGKSTFLRVLSGALEPDSGSIARKRGLRVSFLPQTPSFAPGESLRDFLFAGDAPSIRLVRDYEIALESASAGASNETALAALHHRMEEEGGFALEHSFASLCTELGLPELGARMETFSGGMLKKAGIARCLAPGSDLVLLDEPTNHLDVGTIEWLEARLAAYPGAVLMVTHDRYVLDAVCTTILEIDRARIWAYPGNWGSFLRRRAERWAALEQADERRKAILKIEEAWLARGARARATKSERRKDVIRGMRAAALDRGEAMSGFSTATARLGGKVAVLEGVSKSWDGRVVLAPFDLELAPGERLGIVGPNGAGKSTLLDLVDGRLTPDSGTVERGATVRVGYSDQAARDADRSLTVLDFVRQKADLIRMADGSELDAERLLERFLFPRTMHGIRLEKLSGGEFRRLALVRLLAENPNVLILDEPTNDLDVDTIELLEDFLSGFPGTLLVVSHDRAFLDNAVDVVIALDGAGALERFPGNWSAWREEAARREAASREAAAARAAAEADARKKADAASAGKVGAEGKRGKATWAERKEYEGILDAIAALEAEKDALEAAFSTGAMQGGELKAGTKRHEDLVRLIEEKTVRWEFLAALIEGN
ncbi:MAG: ABC-F family ATP-binding cassette domain-containing protein [Spirochaetales bacterium]|nr:ABC-F family ATP-binding cassette domain-containing protein [Spirochaetales bacterium]